ncbi:hypothetical protein PMSM_10830 [Paenibacillus macquariensis subsp. macquariensis]|uniref:Uncharacterized protein n=1 Tax=Paenibacillus macquariensis TaxID=948756 RepID=A0ABY1KFR0_9BACL|nr:hypothetical protein PMSM_10830 [Paenibacillus macquariensis subsp. macquariensis]SIR62530.1 hypothetical protein SAMN05421578_12412 [Paenibacillus macquariensis]
MNVNNEKVVSVSVESESLLHVDNGRVHIIIDLENGQYSCEGQGMVLLKEVRSGFRWNGREYHTGACRYH